ATFDLDPAGNDTLALLTHRHPDSGPPAPTETSPVRGENEPGFFAADALLGARSASASLEANTRENANAGKTIVILLDTSLSMQWEKLERSYQALEALLRSLKPGDRFNVILFNSQVEPFQPAPASVDRASVERALEFVRASRLRGGTSLQKALEAGL